MRVGFAILLCVLLAPGAFAAAKPPVCPVTGIATAALPIKASSGTAFGDAKGVDVLIAGIAPIPGDAARAALQSTLSSGSVTYAAEKPDRYGRLPAQVFVDGVWLQEKLVREGTAIVMPDGPSAPCLARLLTAEEEARSEHRGNWSSGRFAVRAPEALLRYLGTFQIAEGRVVAAATTGGRTYINFGADRKTDFTVTIAPADMKTFRAQKFRAADLTGKRIRVRGWVESYNDPEMEIAHPEAIEMRDSE